MLQPAGETGTRSAFWDRYAFSVGEVDFQWIDVAIGAMVHADWPVFERRLTEGLACAARADAEGHQPDEGEIDEVATAFRYDRDLISGAEMGAWLDQMALSTDDWMAWVTREVLRRTWADEIDEVLDRFAPSARRVEEAAIAEGICSGSFDRFERACAGRVAMAFDGGPPALATPASPAMDAEAARLMRQHAHWFRDRSTTDISSRLALALETQSRFRAACEAVTAPEALAACLEAHHLQWVRLTVDSLRVDTEAAAREALLCVREDGLSLHDVGALARRPVLRRELFVEDVGAEHRDRWLSAEIGHVQGPLAVDGRFEVSAIVSRTTPTLDDAGVADRARRAAINDALRRAARDRVRRRTNA